MKIPGKGVTAKTICKTYGDYNTINPLVTIRFSFAYDSDFLPEICNATHLPKYIEKGEKTSCITITGVIGHWNRLLDICDDTLKKKIEDCILVKGTKHSFHVPGLREEEIAQYDGKLFGATSTSVFFDLVYY
ncbi:MAG: hypothetical protein HPY87_10305, partial [Fervidobacterium sp.]|uniref:hypothetical protein n=1 Tax=Fervidobacterium sp. TaxID=1871331 RepID=UPI0025BA4E11